MSYGKYIHIIIILFCRRKKVEQDDFLLLCHSYNGPRSDLLDSVNAILLPHGFSPLSNETLLKFILYGNERLTFDTNKKLLQATLQFIHASERF